MNSTTSRISAIALSIALVAGACGGTEAETSDAQAQIDELQAQIEELESAEDAPAPTTTAAPAPTTTEADIVVEGTTSTTVVEAVEPVAEETVVDDVVEPVDEGVGTAEPVAATAGTGFASPAGPALDSSMDPREASDFLQSLLGPTDDFAGQMARVAPFPAVSTLPESEVTGVDLTVSPGGLDGVNANYRINAEVTTTATPDDAVTAYTAEISAIVGGEVDRFTTEDDDLGTVYWAEIGDWQVVAFEFRSLSTVRVSFSTLAGGVPDEVLESINGIITELDLGDGALLERFTVLSDASSVQYNMSFDLDLTQAEAQAVLDGALAETDWTPFDGFQGDYTSPSLPDGFIDADVNEFAEDPASIILRYAWF